MINMEIIDQIMEAVFKEDPQDLPVSGKVSVGAVNGTKSPDADH
jgi:hypothetical protein